MALLEKTLFLCPLGTSTGIAFQSQKGLILPHSAVIEVMSALSI